MLKRGNEAQNVKLNIIFSVFSQIFTVAFALVVPRLMISHYGTEIHGLTSVISNLITYLSLIEAGLGIASVQRLYEPLEKMDYASVNAGLNAITIFYRRITFVFVLLVLILAVLYPLFLSYDLESTLVMALILVAGLAQSIEYLFCRKYKLLLQADKKLYVVNAINTVGVLIQGIMRIALIFSGRSIVLVQLIPSVVYICRLLLLKLYVERTYSYLDRSVQPDFDVGKGKWSALIHQISSLIVNNTDTVVLSVFIGYSAVSVYSIYNMVMSNLNSFLTQSLSNALTANFGHMLSRNDMKACVDYYEKYEKLYSYIVALIFGVCAVMLIPFVSLYCDDLTNVRYADIGIAALFIVNAVLNNIRFHN